MALPFYTDVEVHGRIDIDSAITVDDGATVTGGLIVNGDVRVLSQEGGASGCVVTDGYISTSAIATGYDDGAANLGLQNGDIKAAGAIAAKSLVISTTGADTKTSAGPGNVIVGGTITAGSLKTRDDNSVTSTITAGGAITAKSLVISTAGAHTGTTPGDGNAVVDGALTVDSLNIYNSNNPTSTITAGGAITAKSLVISTAGADTNTTANPGNVIVGGTLTADAIECSSFYREETKFNGVSSGANLDVQLAFSNNNTTATITVPAIKEEGLYYLVARLYTSAGRIIIDQVCWLEDNPVFEHHGRAAYINDYSPVWTDIHYYFWVSPDGLKIVIQSAGALNNSSISNRAQVEITKIFGTSLLPS